MNGIEEIHLTVALLCESEPVSPKEFAAVVAGAIRFLGPMFTYVPHKMSDERSNIEVIPPTGSGVEHR